MTVRDTVCSLGEFGLIQRLVDANKVKLPDEVLGIGDDCAVIPGGLWGGAGTAAWQVITTDAMVEGRHFIRSDVKEEAEGLGWKLAASSISDIAAMGAHPSVCTIVLQIPPDVSLSWIEAVYSGMHEALSNFKTLLVGGDTVHAETVSLSLSVIGFSEKKPLLRSGARAGDDVWLSGAVGGSAAGLAILKEELAKESFLDLGKSVLLRHQRPEPRLALGQALLEESFATSLIDVSDGLIQDASHVAQASGVSLELIEASLPCEAGILEAGFSTAAAVCGGEDYELLFTAPTSANRSLGELSESVRAGEMMPQISRIGSVKPQDSSAAVRIRDSAGEVLEAEKWLIRQGWQQGTGFSHF